MNYSNIDNLVNTLDHVDIAIHATHLDYVNGNALFYTVDAGTIGAKTFIKPFAKPQLLHHDSLSDAVGRVQSAEVLDSSDNPDEPQDFLKLDVRITDKEAMRKVLNGIYLTCSVGSKTTSVKCSICSQELTKDGLCEHEKGDTVEGKFVYWIIDDITYRENSFVNKPADPYSRIVAIDLGNGYIPYKDFIDNREVLINELIMEDSCMKVNDAKLSTAARNKLSDSSFCGPGRSFPAHDKAHVTAGLRLLERSKFSDSTKAKIKGCLYRKGKKYGIGPSKDELTEMPDIKTYRIDEEYSDEEIAAVEKWFEENPNSDSVLDEPATDNVEEEDLTDMENESKEEILKKYEDSVKDGKVKVTSLEKEIKILKDTLSEKDTILNSKEDESSKLLDDNAKLEEKLKKALISHLIDLQTLINDEKNDDEELDTKYNKRQIDSLVDTINDLRSEIVKSRSEDKVEDPTINKDDNKDADTEDKTCTPEGVDEKFAAFYQTEED